MMDNATAFINAVSLIAAGLKEKEHLKEKDRYPYSSRLHHGINIFFSLFVKCSDMAIEDILERAHEAGFFMYYAFKPVREWVEYFRDDVKQELAEKASVQMSLECLCYNLGECEFHISEDCLDYINTINNSDIVSELEEQRFFNLLRQLNQEEYVAVRQFIIQNPVAKQEKLRHFKMLNNSLDAIECVNFAYEDITVDYYVCPNCGWTMLEDYQCVSSRCDIDFDKKSLELRSCKADSCRLKKGIMRYVALPGKIELKLQDYCLKKGLQVRLWPMRDRFDLEIVFSSGKVWEIDAKDYLNPYTLCEKIYKEGGFPDQEGGYEKGFYVVDDYLVKRKRDYCDIVNARMRALGLHKKDIRCVSLTEFKRLLTKEIKKEDQNA